MRVLLINDYPPGAGFGAEVHLDELIEGLSRMGDVVEVFAGSTRRGLARARDLWDPSTKRSVRELESRFRPDVAHFHNVVRELSPSVLTAPKTAARVLTIHDHRLLGSPDGPLDRLPVRLVKQVVARAARALARRTMDAVIATSEPVANRLRAAGFAEVHFVPPFIHATRHEMKPPSESSDVLFAGRLSADKGVQVLIRAFASIADRHVARLLVIGAGPEQERLAAWASKLVGQRVSFLGRLTNEAVREQMARARLVAVPSLTKEVAIPTVAIEAAFAGRPIVATHVAGLRDLGTLGTFGLVVPPGDSAVLANALDVLLADPARCDRMGTDARRTALTVWNADAGIARTHQVYERAVELVRTRNAKTGAR